jgi:hypothetical protein
MLSEMKIEVERQRLEEVLYTYFMDVQKDTPLRRVLYKVGVLNDNKLVSISDELSSLGLMLCGGAINSLFTGTKINDLDFYLRDASKKDAAIAFFTKWFDKGPPYITENAYTFKRKSSASNKVWTVQLITRFTGTPQDILDTFDFTITQGIYDFAEKQFVFGDRFFQDVASRKIVYLGKSHFPICALYRTKKYQARGYELPGSTIMHIALSIVRLDIRSYKQLKEQLHGIDTIYLAGLLRQPKYADDIPVDYGEFLRDAFEAINGVSYEQDDFDEG